MRTFILRTGFAACSVALFAQAPAQPGLSPELRAALPAAQKLVAELKAREADAKLSALLPAEVPAWDKAGPQTQFASYTAYREYTYAFFLAAQAADAAGYWEKSLERFQKARDIAKTNADSVKATFPLIVEYYNNLVAGSKKTLEENADFIKSLRDKTNPDEGDKQQLSLIKGEEESIDKNKKSAEIFAGYIESAKKEADYYAKQCSDEETQINEQIDQLEKYKFKNDKAKFVEGIMSSKTFLDQQFAEKADKVRYLYRLNVLDPSNRKVAKEIEQLTGVSLAVTPSEEKPAPKGKKGKG
jgi:hypothetical protein